MHPLTPRLFTSLTFLVFYLSLMIAASHPHLPRVCALQNAYSLTCRTFDTGLAEVCHLEDVSLMAYSPLAMGLLTVGALVACFFNVGTGLVFNKMSWSNSHSFACLGLNLIYLHVLV
jgi:hypothetical protein